MTQTDLIEPDSVRRALTLFKVTAILVGIGLLLMVAEVILNYGFDNKALAWWPQPHGLLFLAYVAAVANLAFKVRWPLGKMVLVMLAGCVPFLSFWVERKMAADVERTLAGVEGERRQPTTLGA
ncbi:DUF3817 domain-containing protein [Calidifontibacter sp. DB0510]|uniref:DUF3817 domain-containing protein n=1 Tax=Metallococcus carri TaxID=1656884 RepID=A0A967B274_9MICO|nr:DUF3817 domain-containing protein [Metallococcus carri]NHN56632.1 DUF3817 domain-containing protein [Metallococcus carri]NOP38931.1 DUF3817 domain-containing protein [Calidifontibacter sp. DB2511S]